VERAVALPRLKENFASFASLRSLRPPIPWKTLSTKVQNLYENLLLLWYIKKSLTI